KALLAMFLAQLQGALRMVERGFRALQHRIDTRNLPFADNQVFRRSYLFPMKTGGMGRMDHPICFGSRSIRIFHQGPGRIEHLRRHLPVKFRFRIAWCLFQSKLLRNLIPCFSAPNRQSPPETTFGRYKGYRSPNSEAFLNSKVMLRITEKKYHD